MDQRPLFSSYSELLKIVWLSMLTLSVFVVIVFGVQLNAVSSRQSRDLEVINTTLREHAHKLTAGAQDIEAVQVQVAAQSSWSREQNARLDVAVQDVLKITSAVKALSEQSTALKQESRDWQKDYVQALVGIEAKLDVASDQSKDLKLQLQRLAEQFNGFRVDAGAQNIPQMQGDIKTLKYILAQVVSALPAADPLTQSIQRRLHPSVFKDLNTGEEDKNKSSGVSPGYFGEQGGVQPVK